MNIIDTMIFNRPYEIESYLPKTICRSRLEMYDFPIGVRGKIVYVHGSVFHIYPKNNITHSVFYLSKGSKTNLYSPPLELITISKVLDYKVTSRADVILVTFNHILYGDKISKWLQVNIATKKLYYGFLLSSDINRVTIIKSDNFLQLTGSELITYEIKYNNCCLAATTPFNGGWIKEALCYSNRTCVALAYDKKAWSISNFDSNGVTKYSTMLPEGFDYRLALDMSTDQIVNLAGIPTVGNVFTLKHDIFGKEHIFRITYDISVGWKGMVYYDSVSDTIHLAESQAYTNLIVIFTSQGNVITQVEKSHIRPLNRTFVVFTQTHIRGDEKQSSYENMGQVTQQYSGNGNIYDISVSSQLFRNVIASRLAHDVSPDNFPQMKLVRSQSDVFAVTYQNAFAGHLECNCSEKDNALLYSLAAVIGMKINPDSVSCYREAATKDCVLLFTDFSRAAVFEWDGTKMPVLSDNMVMDADRGYVIPYPHLGCDELLPCNQIDLKAIYSMIYNKLVRNFESIIETVACDSYPMESYQNYYTNTWTPELIIESVALEFRNIIGKNLQLLTEEEALV